MAEEKKVTERYELVQIPTQTDIAFRDTEADEEDIFDYIVEEFRKEGFRIIHQVRQEE